MRQLNVLITRSLEDKYLRQISDVSPVIKIFDASDLDTAERSGDYTSKEKFDAMLAEAEVIYGFWPPQNILARSPKLKWIQTMLAGVDHSLYADIFQSRIIVTNTSGIHGTQTSELVFEMMLMFAKNGPMYLNLQKQKKWEPVVPMLLRDKTVGIVGLGSIGKEVARLAKAFGMRVVANRRSIKRVTRTKNVDKLMPSGQLTELLSESDFVILALPATPDTNKIIGEHELRSMKPNAYLINIARGSVVDEEALVRALDERWIAGAGLDTVAKEPLSPESKLWEFPSVIITPHIAGRVDNYNALATDLFCENLRRYLSGEKLLQLVDKKKGY
jgi:phosphoglycerate dehydrogenase-like enzyme